MPHFDETITTDIPSKKRLQFTITKEQYPLLQMVCALHPAIERRTVIRTAVQIGLQELIKRKEKELNVEVLPSEATTKRGNRC